MAGPPPLLAHQREGIEWIHRVERGLLGDEAGLGKSRTAIEAFDGGRVLIVAPAMVITGGTWDDELAKWAKHPEGFTVMPYSKLNARNGNTPNFGTKKNPRFLAREELLQDWDAIILDEAHYIKNRGTSWTVAAHQIAQRAGSVMPMTGTPMPNWAHELFSVLQMIHPDKAKPGQQFGAYHRWIDAWFARTPNPFNKTPGAEFIGGLLGCRWRPACLKADPSNPCEHYIEFARENFGDAFLRRMRDDVLDLPPLTESRVLTEMSSVQRRMYNDLKRDYLTNTPDDEELVAWSDGTRNVMLDKLTTSDWLLGDMTGPPRGGKFDRLAHDLGTRSSPTLVLAHYRDTVDGAVRIAESLGQTAMPVHGGVRPAEKAEAVRRFKAGELDVLVGSLSTLAEGLTLTRADMTIFMEKSYRPDRNEQALRRVHRIGQERPVTVLDYVAPRSVDENRRKMLEKKTTQQQRVLSAAEFARML